MRIRALLTTVFAGPLRAAVATVPRLCVYVLMATAALICAGLPIASAQDVRESIRRCAAESDDARRLECYDREVGRLATATETGQPATPAPSAAPTLSPEERFGLSEEQTRRKQNIPEAPKLERLTATVTKITRRPHGELVMTLHNGQVWAEKQTTSFVIQEGDAVTIKAATLGSFLMVTSSGRSTRVARVQ